METGCNGWEETEKKLGRMGVGSWKESVGSSRELGELFGETRSTL